MNIEIEPEVTADQIASHYAAALDSVALISSSKPELLSDEEWEECINRNKEHLQIMLAKDFWTTEDLSPLEAAVQD